MKKPFVMDKDVYDAIDLVSEAEGGLTAGSPYEGERCGCMIGAAHFAGVYGDAPDAYEGYFDREDIGESPTPEYGYFDSAHRAIREEQGNASRLTRLPWSQVAERMNVIRGA